MYNSCDFFFFFFFFFFILNQNTELMGVTCPCLGTLCILLHELHGATYLSLTLPVAPSNILWRQVGHSLLTLLLNMYRRCRVRLHELTQTGPSLNLLLERGHVARQAWGSGVHPSTIHQAGPPQAASRHGETHPAAQHSAQHTHSTTLANFPGFMQQWRDSDSLPSWMAVPGTFLAKSCNETKIPQVLLESRQVGQLLPTPSRPASSRDRRRRRAPASLWLPLKVTLETEYGVMMRPSTCLEVEAELEAGRAWSVEAIQHSDDSGKGQACNLFWIRLKRGLSSCQSWCWERLAIGRATSLHCNVLGCSHVAVTTARACFGSVCV